MRASAPEPAAAGVVLAEATGTLAPGPASEGDAHPDIASANSAQHAGIISVFLTDTADAGAVPPRFPGGSHETSTAVSFLTGERGAQLEGPRVLGHAFEEAPPPPRVPDALGAREQPHARLEQRPARGRLVARRQQRLGVHQTCSPLAFLDRAELAHDDERALGLLASAGGKAAREQHVRERSVGAGAHRRVVHHELRRDTRLALGRVELAGG